MDIKDANIWKMNKHLLHVSDAVLNMWEFSINGKVSAENPWPRLLIRELSRNFQSSMRKFFSNIVESRNSFREDFLTEEQSLKFCTSGQSWELSRPSGLIIWRKESEKVFSTTSPTCASFSCLNNFNWLFANSLTKEAPTQALGPSRSY